MCSPMALETTIIYHHYNGKPSNFAEEKHQEMVGLCGIGHAPSRSASQNPSKSTYPIGSMYAICGNMDPINIPQMLAYIPAPWILWVLYKSTGFSHATSWALTRGTARRASHPREYRSMSPGATEMPEIAETCVSAMWVTIRPWVPSGYVKIAIENGHL